MDEQMTFKRYELKFMLDREQRSALEKAMAGHLALDAYGRSTIRNLYFDTDSYRLVRTSIEKPVYKEKLRVRSYHQATEDSEVFVELKKKFESVVYKRRICLPHRAAMDALERQAPLPAEGQIAREIACFRQFYGPTLKPAMFLSYEREAYFPVDGTDFRLTLDENILWRTQGLDLAASCWGRRVIPGDQTLMELKTPGGLPLWMVRFLSAHKIYQTSFSKYGAAYQQMISAERMKGAMCYAV